LENTLEVLKCGAVNDGPTMKLSSALNQGGEKYPTSSKKTES
jgi:hypothetical protein